ncbi:sensory box-containing diguanylate cyclase, putative [Erythrobacter sp. NAP1]|nr:sensory box-containing diguanylate cyclase, putative [Erythrobacter sp. NAP1]
MLAASPFLPGSELGIAPTIGASKPDARATDWLHAYVGSTDTTSLLIACLTLTIIALVALSSTMVNRREMRFVAREARSRSETMRELLRTMRMAECIAGIGVWEYDYAAGVQHWSDGLKRLFGISADAEFTPGDAETLLFANGADLVGQIRAKGEEVEPYNLTLDIYGFDGVERTLLIQACNLRGADGTVQRVVAVVKEGKSSKPVAGANPQISSSKAINGLRTPETCADSRDRGAIMRTLDRLVVSARAGKHSLTMVMFDVRIRPASEEAQRSISTSEMAAQVARISRWRSRSDELVGRLGEEQFVWLLPEISENAARVHANALRRAIESEYRCDGVHFSIGVAGLQPGDSALSLIARADDAMNCVNHPETIKVEVSPRVSA